MFIHNLHEDTKYYLKSLLVERRDSSKSKKDDKKDETPPVNQPPAVLPQSSEIVVPPTKTTLSQEEREKKEREQKAAEEKERQERTISSNMADDINTSVYPFKETTAATGGGIYRWGRSTRPDEELDTRSILPGSGRGRGAPAVTGEPSDATGMKNAKDMYYNYDVLLGKSLSSVKETSDASNIDPLVGAVIDPYKDLQRIKMAKAYLPGILGKIKSVIDVESSKGFQQMGVSGAKKFQRPKTWTGLFDVNKQIPDPTNPKRLLTPSEIADKQIDELLASNYIANQQNLIADLRNYAQSNPDVVDALYQVTEGRIKRAEKGFPEASLQGKIQKHAEKLSGLGGLDPYFGEELAAKLLGGEWVEKAMQNIAPSVERGVISSMGHRGSIGM